MPLSAQSTAPYFDFVSGEADFDSEELCEDAGASDFVELVVPEVSDFAEEPFSAELDLEPPLA